MDNTGNYSLFMKDVQQILKDVNQESLQIASLGSGLPLRRGGGAPDSGYKRQDWPIGGGSSLVTKVIKPADTRTSDALARAVIEVQQIIKGHDRLYSELTERHRPSASLETGQLHHPGGDKNGTVDKIHRTDPESARLQESKVINLKSLRGENIDTYVKPRPPLEEIVSKA